MRNEGGKSLRAELISSVLKHVNLSIALAVKAKGELQILIFGQVAAARACNAK